MKKLSICLFLIFFSFQTSSLGEDIGDLEVAGMSVGDSLLDYFSEEEILSNEKYSEDMKDDRFKTVEFYKTISSEEYDSIAIIYNSKDKKFIIHKIKGGIFYRNNIKDCYSKKNAITEDLSVLFKDVEWKNTEYEDEDGFFSFSTKYLKSGTIKISCYDWNSKLTMEKNWHDNLRVTIETKEYNNWLKSINPIYSD